MTAGEPAGIGPDLALALAGHALPGEFVVLGDWGAMLDRIECLGLDVELREPDGSPHQQGVLNVVHVPVRVPVRPGELVPENSASVIKSIEMAIDGCLSGQFSAMVTGPVHKAAIIDGGFDGFTGHTEFLAERTNAKMPVMLLASDELRVALVTTHLPLSEVPAAITPQRITDVTRVLASDLTTRFGIDKPVIGVCGLNPHAGESGHLGREEIEIIEPTLEALRSEGVDVRGPLPADTAFTPGGLAGMDAMLAMYHDQGLPVIKHHGFDRAVNVTLGLPIIRTSVDHGTALDLAGTGRADSGSLIAAVKLAFELGSHASAVKQ